MTLFASSFLAGFALSSRAWAQEAELECEDSRTAPCDLTACKDGVNPAYYLIDGEKFECSGVEPDAGCANEAALKCGGGCTSTRGTSNPAAFALVAGGAGLAMVVRRVRRK